MRRLLTSLIAATAASAAFAQAPVGKTVYDSACAACHATGVIGAPKYGDAAAWKARLANGGVDALYRNAIAGTPRGMPPKGGRAELPDASIRAGVDYMLASAGLAKAPAAPAAAAQAKPAAPPPAAAAPATAAAQAKPVTPPAAPAPTAAAPAVAAAAAATPAAAPVAAAPSSAADAADVNAFNRLLKPAGRFNLPATESGIHDPANDGTQQLQPPAAAFTALPRSNAGNHVDWVKSLDQKKIAPRWDRENPAAAAVVMDLNIVREVKGSMPDVVYPHKQHTEWLDCSNCHPGIFVPQKGANQISMAAILLGQKCGVCHGKVAFPVSECRLCHSKKKDLAATPASTRK